MRVAKLKQREPWVKQLTRQSDYPLLTHTGAVLSLLGDRINSLRVPYLGRRILDSRSAGRTSWIARVAYRAMKRPAIGLR